MLHGYPNGVLNAVLLSLSFAIIEERLASMRRLKRTELIIILLAIALAILVGMSVIFVSAMPGLSRS